MGVIEHPSKAGYKMKVLVPVIHSGRMQMCRNERKLYVAFFVSLFLFPDLPPVWMRTGFS